jgi:hypothetical protein
VVFALQSMASILLEGGTVTVRVASLNNLANFVAVRLTPGVA